ncbi:MAG: DUF5606 domain-containing protein [Rikenellaceae bacterium]|nr:DUF5606 domain-containing protein [Rikenellaceae bacterium]
MELKKILAISGQPGLYKFVAQSKNGVIVESLADGRRTNAPASSKVSSMAEISIFTDTDDVPLAKVFEAIFAHTGGKPTIEAKSDAGELKKLFAAILPDYDRDRVHVSDMKKVVAWFNILVGQGMTEFKLDEPEEEAEATEEK